MAIALITQYQLRPDCIDPFCHAALHNARASLAQETGCQQFDVCHDMDEPSTFVLYETYDDVAAVQAHLASVHFSDFDRSTRAWVTERTVRVCPRVFP
ncbi:MAG: antibiotic biosynthesis monooxygenase [Pseudomonadota bacterium]